MAWLRGTLPPLFLVLSVLAATWKLAFADRIIARGDLLLYFYPLRDYAAQAVREGRLPLWNPYTFMGAPFLANSQAGFFYPLNVLMAWLPTEQAVSLSIVLHLAIAALGMYALARAGLQLGTLAATAAAIAFGLGGYLGAQVEHLNQLQVLAWLPLQVLIVYRIGHADTLSFTPFLRRMLVLALLIALQVAAGHTQSLYICLVTLGLTAVVAVVAYTLTHRHTFKTLASLKTLATLLAPVLLIGLAGAFAALLSAGQLLPTLELSRESYRNGGLSLGEVASFSWRPWVVGRALLPGYGDAVFPEYVAYLGALGLALAVLGVLHRDGRRSGADAATGDGFSSVPGLPSFAPAKLLALTFVILGFILALGIATPLFNLLYYWLPGFNLFRAQARWLVVFALGLSLLVGLGVQALRSGLALSTRRGWLLGWLVLMGSMAGAVVLGARISPEPEYATLPIRRVLMNWAVAAGVASLFVMLAQFTVKRIALHRGLAMLFTGAMLIELLAGAQYQPYARAADRQALTDLRPTTAHLLAGQKLGETGRVLALSGLFFDPGDMPEQTLIYQNQLDKDELYDRVIASKQKEVLSPNLSLYYRLPSVDGYDGGLLPTRRFVQFASQFTPTPKTGTLDGRLREFLKAVPAESWLDQMAVRYIIADKTQDIFVDGVYYDLLFSAQVSPALTLTLAPYESTALGFIISATHASPNQMVATGQIRFTDETTHALELRAPADPAQLAQPYFAAQVNWDARNTADARKIVAQVDVQRADAIAAVQIRGLTSIDATDHSFLSQPIRAEHNMRVAHSGDVKIYENLAEPPRAFLRGPITTAVANSVTNAVTNAVTHAVTLIEDSPEQVVLQVQTAQPAQLILRDACYPGWVARIDGRETPITCTDILFRQIDVPATTSANASSQRVVFSYEPQPVRIGLIVSAASLLIWLVLALIVARRKPVR